MLTISRSALREGCDRAADLFLLSRLQEPGASAETFSAVFEALGVDAEMREELERALVDLVPVKGLPSLEAAMANSMLGGVLVGWLIAASALPEDQLELPVVTS
jgi:hypothetical protein